MGILQSSGLLKNLFALTKFMPCSSAFIPPTYEQADKFQPILFNFIIEPTRKKQEIRAIVSVQTCHPERAYLTNEGSPTTHEGRF
jgi:hypothetical protein